MNYRDFILPPQPIKTEKWQLGNFMKNELPENGIALIWLSDYRGAGGEAEVINYTSVRKQLYKLSNLDFQVPVFDFGDLISGKTIDDTHYILQEVVSSCHYQKTIPVVIGGGNDFSYSLFSALNFHQKNIEYTQISNCIHLDNDNKELNEKTFLAKIFSSKNFTLKTYNHLAFQKHLNDLEGFKLMNDIDFNVIRLAQMMNGVDFYEPFLRHSDLVTLNCNAVESSYFLFSINPQVNGLNNREICACMKEIGLGKKLKSVGVFNNNPYSENTLNDQMLAQLIWHLIEGINIQKSHPTKGNYETYHVLIDDVQYTFKKDAFSGLWYFGNDDSVENCLPCSLEDYENAKRFVLSKRLLNFHS